MPTGSSGRRNLLAPARLRTGLGCSSPVPGQAPAPPTHIPQGQIPSHVIEFARDICYNSTSRDHQGLGITANSRFLMLVIDSGCGSAVRHEEGCGPQFSGKYHGSCRMERFQTVLLKVWREACRHIEIGQSVATIAPMLVRDLPLEQLYVRRIDSPRSCVETVALGFPTAQRGQVKTRTECSLPQVRRLITWCKRGTVARCGSRQRRTRGAGGGRAGRSRRGFARRTTWQGRSLSWCTHLVGTADAHVQCASRGAGASAAGAIFDCLGQRPAASRNEHLARSGRGRQTLTADPAGTRETGRHDCRCRVRAAHRHGTGGAGGAFGRAGADLRRDRNRQGTHRPNDPRAVRPVGRPGHSSQLRRDPGRT